MVKFRFSQTNITPEFKARIRRIWKVVSTKATPDLLIKVAILNNQRSYYSGNYRNITVHGFYDREWEVKG